MIDKNALTARLRRTKGLPAPTATARPQRPAPAPVPEQQRKPTTRLPIGAAFSLRWNGANWSGSLTVPVTNGEPIIVTSAAGALFTLCSRLDGMFRKAAQASGSESISK